VLRTTGIARFWVETRDRPAARDRVVHHRFFDAQHRHLHALAALLGRGAEVDPARCRRRRSLGMAQQV
jgi:hypothetical protein